MEKNNIIERFGGLIKEEPLSSLEPEACAQGTCVLEAEMPFLGYYQGMDHFAKPHYLYCILGGFYSFEMFMRATQQVRVAFGKPFDAALTTISLYGTVYQAIRIRNLERYTDICTLQHLYMDEGITMRKRSRTLRNAMAMIKLRKFFYLEPTGDGLYIDRAEEHHGYFIINRQLHWEEFKSITKEVKFDPSYFHFDGAIAFFYEHEKVFDMIRIYRERLSKEELTAIRNHYMKFLQY